MIIKTEVLALLHAAEYWLLDTIRRWLSSLHVARMQLGHDVQVILVAPDGLRKEGYEKDDTAMWLASGWWVMLRNQCVQAPDVALKILVSVQDDLSAITAEATTARGKQAEDRCGTLLERSQTRLRASRSTRR